ncbi:Gfo/Idh/MocA family oxidoreductase [Pontibacter qinzhouensis]|uniref:Gfo/Idh/MocA family oxidoreductase n=1 Tax=Pontibacter qinzhouensis TaxID=2603253 RepID=A0A5C8KCP8_9BACT|nr:Gfo/Idh/MocA family oxidoreductase [Pontibacter qinzhouensis]TXK49124.1 Gfo/Idh/MocA family oxidoreductase [Pontibacter qinzhouensis]
MKMNWGILGAAKIALEKVIPAMAGHPDFQVHGIASRNLDKAKVVAERFGIPKAYGSYEELIADPEIQIIYNPLPNHLHAQYTLKCIQAGKHVLCEKPIALSSDEVKSLIAARDQHQVKVGEAFMVRSHPQWQKTRDLVQRGTLGKIKLIQGSFSYFNITPDNIRNIAAYGGGAIWDIGCYPITICRYVLGEEPLRIISLLETDPGFGTDKLSSVLMQFPSVQVSFSVSTQLVPYQRMHFFGENQQLEVLIPFNAPKDTACEIKLNAGDILQKQVKTITFDVCDQYRLMAAAFTEAVRDNKPVPVSLEDSLANTLVIEAIFRSAREHRWVNLKEINE